MSTDFFASAPYRYVCREVLHRSPEAIFFAIARDPAGWGGWFPGFDHRGRYLTGDPYGVGSLREVFMTRVRFAEKIMVWDEPHRWAFHLTESAVPLAHAMAEDYQVTAQGDHAVVQWTFAIDPSAGLKPAMPLAQPLLPRLFRRAMTNLSIRLGQNQSQR